MAWYRAFWWILAGNLMIIKSTANADCSINPTAITERPNNDVFLSCTCTGVNATAYSIKWCLERTCAYPLPGSQDYHTGTEILSSQEVRNILTVIYAQVDDSVTYYCEGNGNISAEADINIVDVPVAQLLPVDASVTDGEDTVLECRLLNGLKQIVNETAIWRKNNVKIIKEDLDGDGDVDVRWNDTHLYIKNADSSDGGSYSCGLDDQEFEVKDIVVIKTAVKIKNDESVKAKIGSEVSLSCSAKGYPLASFQWQGYTNVSDSETQDWLSSTVTSTLVIPKFTESDVGSYKCSATNGVGEIATANIVLSVGREVHLPGVDSSGCSLSSTTWTCPFLLLLYTCISYISLT